jgi:xanthine/CO dehydrogenase XdhC/CoxF family maturation factor
MATDTEEIFPHIERWKSGGQGVALATVVQTWGSSRARKAAILQ